MNYSTTGTMRSLVILISSLLRLSLALPMLEFIPPYYVGRYRDPDYDDLI